MMHAAGAKRASTDKAMTRGAEREGGTDRRYSLAAHRVGLLLASDDTANSTGEGGGKGGGARPLMRKCSAPRRSW